MGALRPLKKPCNTDSEQSVRFVQRSKAAHEKLEEFKLFIRN